MNYRLDSIRCWLDRARPGGVVTLVASKLAAGPSLAGATVLAGQETDDDVEEGDDAIDDGHYDSSDASDDGHDGAADCAEGGLELWLGGLLVFCGRCGGACSGVGTYTRDYGAHFE